MKIKNKVRLYGAGGHAQIIKFIIQENNTFLEGVYDDDPKLAHKNFHGVRNGFRLNQSNFVYDDIPFIIAIGNNRIRAEIAGFLKCSFSNAVHTSAIISENVHVGEGTVIYAGAIIQPNTSIGKHVIINTAANVDHDNTIHDFVHISPNATLCGLVEVGTGSHIGAGAVIIPQIKIGEWCVIGAGSVVIHDVPDFAVVVGNPGKIIKINR
ncbi:acetyltransferase [Cellulophaga sp. Hel_I_12]|uniref:acetyltransferase n=1 Tax=Cellulophaga sp. Hel_I_12 TaxID=1249972 RepID=UPI00064590B5|nr:acetyltransferase [Cellulophaga sp. Hel_I_12]